MAGGTYSFLDVNASITGPGGSFNFGSGAGVTDEGISISYKEDKNIQTSGAGGEIMNALNATKAGRIVVRLLKTSPVNAQLSQLYNLQSQSSALWGNNVVSIKNAVSGDSILCTSVAFKKHADVTFDKPGRHNEWEFDASIDFSLGGGLLTNIATFASGTV